ncbi:MAG TPA: hypothetical protein VFG81_03015 [Anaerolineales bacterium]|jgi:hypothetical protein|nr:hypothetical protein [Anaerolineales bacterium]
MKRLSIFTLILVATLILSACGAEPPPPTMNAVDVQNTAVAAAFTMVAQTQAAIPTATPLPPTEAPTQTPLPTDTPLPLPTTNVTVTSTTAPVSSNNSGGDPCQTRVLSPERGRETIIRVVNTTNVTITVSMYLNETAAHGECGYRGFTLSKNNDIVYTDLVQGCYNLWAWSDDPKGKFSSSGGGCINNPDKWTFEVRPDIIKFTGP